MNQVREESKCDATHSLDLDGSIRNVSCNAHVQLCRRDLLFCAPCSILSELVELHGQSSQHEPTDSHEKQRNTHLEDIGADVRAQPWTDLAADDHTGNGEGCNVDNLLNGGIVRVAQESVSMTHYGHQNSAHYDEDRCRHRYLWWYLTARNQLVLLQLRQPDGDHPHEHPPDAPYRGRTTLCFRCVRNCAPANNVIEA